uniref:hypothetical protein n=1 Tax=Pseudomaricurvus sp. TaxID=2004510 RepID=UPI003F6C138B
MTISLRRRLLFILLGLILSSWLISVIITALFAQQTLLKQIDQQLAHNLEMSRYTLGSIYEDPVLADYYQSKSVPIRTEPGVARVNGFGSQGRELATNLWFKRTQILVGREAPIFPKRLQEGVVHTEINSNGETSAWRILYRYDRTLNIWIASGLNMTSVSSMG